MSESVSWSTRGTSYDDAEQACTITITILQTRTLFLAAMSWMILGRFLSKYFALRYHLLLLFTLYGNPINKSCIVFIN